MKTMKNVGLWFHYTFLIFIMYTIFVFGIEFIHYILIEEFFSIDCWIAFAGLFFAMMMINYFPVKDLKIWCTK